ncbi:MAG: site-2 protease family protein [Candidatus Nealsonbacteria bacterium]|nr:site-2 protease family protein [Candidatus Nealsonbacteria bacterium]
MPIEITIIFSLIVLLFSVIIHELSHGTVALALGDQTAKYAGRLTLNPIAHLDLFGSVIFPLMLVFFASITGQGLIFGWAKPVPINPNNFKNPRWDSVKVALAGPLSNILLAVFFGLLIRFLPLPLPLLYLFSIIVIMNFLLALFNLLPIPPLDGSHLLFSILPDRFWKLKVIMSQYGFFILIFLIFFLGGIQLVSFGALFLYVLTTGQLPIF